MYIYGTLNIALILMNDTRVMFACVALKNFSSKLKKKNACYIHIPESKSLSHYVHCPSLVQIVQKLNVREMSTHNTQITFSSVQKRYSRAFSKDG